MSAVNDMKFQHAMFFLTGLFGQEYIHVWISIPFCLIYVTSILGNSVILLIIKSNPILHVPRYIFLSMLSVPDLGISIMTTTLVIFWFNSREISHNACFAQLFFIHALTFTESTLLLCMAFEHFVAICHPHRYASILTLPKIANMGLVSLLRGVFLNLQLPILLKQYYKANILSHSNCLQQSIQPVSLTSWVSGLDTALQLKVKGNTGNLCKSSAQK